MSRCLLYFRILLCHVSYDVARLMFKPVDLIKELFLGASVHSLGKLLYSLSRSLGMTIMGLSIMLMPSQNLFWLHCTGTVSKLFKARIPSSHPLLTILGHGKCPNNENQYLNQSIWAFLAR